jgi:hypothetical protein
MQNKEIILTSVYFFLNKKGEKLTKNDTNNKGNNYKLANIDFFVLNEIDIVKKIHLIPKYKTHFRIFSKFSHTNISQIDDNSQYLNANTFIKKENQVLLGYEKDDIIYFKNYLKALSSPRIYIYNLIEIYRYLLHSIDLLVSHNIIHNHICLESIVLGKNQLPLINDFSLSIDILKENMHEYIKHFIIEYNSSYLEWPTEFHILAYLLTNKLDSLSSNNIETIINNIIDNNSILKIFGPNIVTLYKSDAIQYYQKYINASYTEILTDMLKYSNTWDNYALSIMYLRILIGLHKTIKKDNKFILFFMKLLVVNIHLNPLKRFSIQETHNKFENIIDGLDSKVYKELLDLMSTR